MENIIYGLVEVCIVLIIFINITDTISKKRKMLLSVIALAAMLLTIADHFSDLYNTVTTISGGYIARIIAVADTYDAMASRRSYRNSLPMEKIRDEITKGMGTQFDSKFANIIVELIDSGEVR